MEQEKRVRPPSNEYIKELDRLRGELGEAKSRVRVLEHNLAELVLNFPGSLSDAFKCGLVRLTFAAPSWFYREIGNR